jgi:hypothetical protein
VATRCPHCAAQVTLPPTFFADPDEPVAAVRRAPPAPDWSAFQFICIVLLWVIGIGLLAAFAVSLT